MIAVHGGLLSLEEACRRYELTVEEFSCWERDMQVEPQATELPADLLPEKKPLNRSARSRSPTKKQ